VPAGKEACMSEYIDHYYRSVLGDFRLRGLKILDRMSRVRSVDESTQESVATDVIVVDATMLDWKKFVQKLTLLLDTLERLIEFTEKYENEPVHNYTDSDKEDVSNGSKSIRKILVQESELHTVAVRCSMFLCKHER